VAQRRMFSLKIVDSDSFLDMPISARLLYFDLCMRADDDGFISSPKKIMRMTGASHDDFKILIVKEYIITFENGICVITHWKIHNYIQKDRYQETIYKEEKRLLNTDENKVYTKCIQDVSKMDTQVRLELEVGKSKSKGSGSNSKFFTTTTASPFETFKKNIGELTPHLESRLNLLIEKGIDNELLTKYIEVATERGKGNLAYIESMAIGNLKDNVKTLNDYENYCSKNNNKSSRLKDKIPQHNFDQREYSTKEYEKFISNKKKG